MSEIQYQNCENANFIRVENSPAYNVFNVTLFDILQNDINHFTDLGKVLVCGDFNARVGNSKRHDYIVNDRIVDGIDNDDYIPDIPLDRISTDNGTNSHGLKMIDLCKSTSLHIANGRLHDDKGVGNYTYCNKQGASVIDYLLLRASDFYCIDKFKIESFNEWSNHAPLSYMILVSDNNQRPVNKVNL